MFYLFAVYCLLSVVSLDATDFENLQELEDQDFEQQLAENLGK
jgi:hypothetical protein